MRTSEITESTVKSYRVKTPHGDTGTVVIETGERFARVLAHSSFGSFCATWSATPYDPMKYLLNINFDSAMDYFRPTDLHVYAPDLQEQHLKALVIDLRRKKEVNQDIARALFNDAGGVASAESADQFRLWLSTSDLFDVLFQYDWAQVDVKTRVDPQCQAFWNDLWLPLMNYIAAKNMQEREAAPV